jgi:hypothetical protein
MSEYPITWIDTQLISGRQFSAATCGYEERICFFSLDGNRGKYSSVSEVKIEEQNCDISQNCLALDCSLNTTTRECIANMLGMQEDEEVFGETANLWGTDSMTEGLLRIIQQLEKDILANKERSKIE